MESQSSAVSAFGSALSKRGRHLVLLFFSVFLIYNANLRGLSSGDCAPARLLPFSILREGNLTLDEFHLHNKFSDKSSGADSSQTPYFALEQHGHLFSQYPVVLPIVITPLYLPVVLLLDTAAPVGVDNPLVKGMEKLSASLIATLSVIFVYLALQELCAPRSALWLAFLYAFGTNTWTISSQALWQHGLSELSLSLMVYAFLKSRRREAWLVLAGLGAALATANRPPNIVFASLALVYVWRYHYQALARFLLFPGLIGSLLLIYNLWLLPISPLLKYMSLSVLCQIFLYSSFHMWWGGHSFGSRAADIPPPTGVDPFSWGSLALCQYPNNGRFFYPAGRWNATPVSVDTHPERLWDWRDTQIRRSLQHGPVLPASRLLPRFLFGGEESSTDRRAPIAQN